MRENTAWIWSNARRKAHSAETWSELMIRRVSSTRCTSANIIRCASRMRYSCPSPSCSAICCWMRRNWVSLRPMASSKRRTSLATSSVKMRRSCTSTRPPRKWATPMAMPGEAPTPANLSIRHPFAKAVAHQRQQRIHRVLRVDSAGHHRHLGAPARHQGE